MMAPATQPPCLFCPQTRISQTCGKLKSSSCSSQAWCRSGACCTAAELAFSLPALPLAHLLLTEEDAQGMDAYALTKAALMSKTVIRKHTSCMTAIAAKPASCTRIPDTCLEKKERWTLGSLGPLEKRQVKDEALGELRVELSKKYQARELDGFGLYL